MSLPDAWVDRIFEKLALVYGHAFLSRWDGMPIADVKADWSRELSRFQQNHRAIAYALEHLPARPPTVLEFRALCNSPQAPAPEQPLALPPIRSKWEEDHLAWLRHLPRLQKVRREVANVGGVAWAYALKLKDEDPDEPRKVTPLARQMYREAIANHQRFGMGGGQENAAEDAR